MNKHNDGRDFESYVRYACTVLLGREGCTADVITRRKFPARSGATPEIDVYYEFERAGVLHRVAFECKDLNDPADYGHVAEFSTRLADIGGLKGIMVSRHGYRPAAVKLAQSEGIVLLTLGQELPDQPQLMGLMVDDACIPGPDAVGDPFWVLMPVIEGGRGGGMYVPIPDANGESLLPLFIARPHAERFLERAAFAEVGVFGMTQRALRFLLGSAAMGQLRLAIGDPPTSDDPRWHFRIFTPREVWGDFVRGDYPFPADAEEIGNLRGKKVRS